MIKRKLGNSGLAIALLAFGRARQAPRPVEHYCPNRQRYKPGTADQPYRSDEARARSADD